MNDESLAETPQIGGCEPEEHCETSASRSNRLTLIHILLGILCAATFFRPATVHAASQNDALSALLARMTSGYAQINDYSAIFHKQERVNGKLLPEETILLKFQKPQKVYMKWIADPLKGTEALYVAGRNDNKLVAHRGGVLGLVTLSLNPRGSKAMEGNRHPITEVGFGFLSAQIQQGVAMAIQFGECEIVRMGEEVFQGRPTTVVEARFTPREGRKYYAARMVCHFDKESSLPVGAVFYDNKDALFEKYYYTDVKLNAGLTDADFSRGQ